NISGADKLSYAMRYAADNCRLVWVSLGELIRGSASISDLIGPVGMGGAVNSIVTAEITVLDRVWNILGMMILISLNLAIVNLLPIPALDGGRLLFLLIEAVRRKPLPSKIEGAIHGAAMICLFALMVLVMFNDIVKLVRGVGP
ncbi:MAG: site-2 protease family protein, partial [Oscillospiraceae bacterium]|nr:site-2 protease family protein [Oscillospiraceae bacterium]